MTSTAAAAKIDDIRAGLTDRDAENNDLVSIVRDLEDGYPLADVRAAAGRLVLGDYDAEQQIKAIVAAIAA